VQKRINKIKTHEKIQCSKLNNGIILIIVITIIIYYYYSTN